MLLKRNNCLFFFGNSPVRTQVDFEKMCVHQKGECCESFPECLNGLGCMHKLIKKSIFWKHWVNFNRENEPKP